MRAVTWANEAAVCDSCRRPFRLSEEAIAGQLAETGGNEATRADAVAAIQFCLGCCDGESPAGEYDVIAYYGWVWKDGKWAIVLAWKCGACETWPTVRSQQRFTGVTFARGEQVQLQKWVLERNREIAAARGKAATCAR